MTQRVSGVQDPFDNEGQIVYPEPKQLCKVMIVKPYAGECPAELCLEIEGIAFDLWIVDPTNNYSGHPEAYASHLVNAWQAGEEFINVEHDVAPWPGALEQMWHCDAEFCYFQYPMFPPGRHGSGIGCCKFGQSLIEALPHSWEDWGNVPWWDLDAAIISELKVAGIDRHEHLPYVAHARRPAEGV
jgi:hypothetical protein